MATTLIAGPSVAPAGTHAKGDTPAKIHDAAQQFEALLLGQMLRSERESGNGWLSNDDDSAADCATDFAEQQFATLLSKQGGLGLSNLIVQGLERNK
ncbi:MAG TPA: hypothetical protein VG675_24840 [Bryobacteraceae bacterium]|nr:hypothetical protein [Bryobacteraceae bacterium]